MKHLLSLLTIFSLPIILPPIDASMFIKTIEDRQGLEIGCVEEIAYRMGYINAKQLKELSGQIKTSYGDYLRGIFDEQ